MSQILQPDPVASENYQTDPAVEPLTNVLGYVSEVVRLGERVVERLADHRLANGEHFILHQQELDDLPGVTRDTFDGDGAVWLSVEQLQEVGPPPVPSDLAMWIDVTADPEQKPLVRDSVLITLDSAEKDRLVAANGAQAEDCLPAINSGGPAGIWNVRLTREHRADIAARLDAYVAGPWTAWAGTERLRRGTMELYRRLHRIAQLTEGGGSERPLELVWGIGVSRWRTRGRVIDLPVLERLVEIEVENASGRISIRPRAVGAIANLRAFESFSHGGARLALDSADRIIGAIESSGEISPFVRDSFEPILSVVSSQLDPNGAFRPDQGPHRPRQSLPEATKNLVVSDRWVLFARLRSESFVLRDIERLKDEIDRASESENGLAGVAGAFLHDPNEDRRGAGRRPLPNVIGRPIDIEPSSQDVPADHGDLFFPLPFGDDQVAIVRQLDKSDGLVMQGAPGSGKSEAIANIICHHLALGLRVLVVAQGGAALAAVHKKLPSAIRDLTISLTGTDKEGLRQAESAVRKLQSIVETCEPHDQVALISQLEYDVIAARREIEQIDGDLADITHDSLKGVAGVSGLPLDIARSLAAEGDGGRWFADRPPNLLPDSDVSVTAVDAARAARIRLASDLQFIDDQLPATAELPDVAALVRLHADLRTLAEPSTIAGNESAPASRAVALLGVEAAGQVAADLDSLVAAHRVIGEEPWLGALSPLARRDGEAPPDVAALIDFARDTSSQLSRRAAFLARPVETPADAFANQDVLDLVDRLAAGRKSFTAFGLRGNELDPVIASIRVAGFAPAGPGDWAHVRTYLAWRRDVHALNARWRSLAPEVGAPQVEADSQTFHGLERIAKCVDVAIVATAVARQNVMAVAESKLSMSAEDVEAMIADSRRLKDLSAAIRSAVNKIGASRSEFARLKALFSGDGVLAASIRDDFLSRIGRDDIDGGQVETNWTRIRERIAALQSRRKDFELIAGVAKAIEQAGAPVLARRIRTEPASPQSGDPVLASDWATQWNSAALMRQMEDRGQHQRLHDLANQRQQLETRLRDLLGAVVAARTHLGLARNVSGAVKQALTVFVITLQKIGATGPGPAASRLRRVAREALEGCHEGIPCWLMPSWRVAEQLPPKLGGFDLVVIDEASQCDMRELTALLRGRKVLVAGEDKPVGAKAIGIDNDKIERLERTFLRNVPKTIRPFLSPGTSLFDLFRVVFPDKLFSLKDHSRPVEPTIRLATQLHHHKPDSIRIPADEPPGLPSKAIHVLDPHRKVRKKLTEREADVMLGEIATIVGKLARHRGPINGPARAIGTPSQPGGRAAATIDEGTNAPAGVDEHAADDRRGGRATIATDQDAAGGAAPADAAAIVDMPIPTWAIRREVPAAPEPQPSHRADAAPRVAGQRETVGQDAPVTEAGIEAFGELRDEALSPGEASPYAPPSIRHSLAPIPANDTGINSVMPPSFTQRSAPLVDRREVPKPWVIGRLMALGAVAIIMALAAFADWPLGLGRTSANGNPPVTTRQDVAGTTLNTSDHIGVDGNQGAIGDRGVTFDAGAVAPIAQRVVLYEEDPIDPRGKRYTGSVSWRTESAPPGPGLAPETTIIGDVAIEGGRLNLTMTFRRNGDAALPASHVIELKFNLPEDSPYGGLSNISGIKMKQADQARGAPLVGRVAKVTPRFFLVGLSSIEADMQRNLKLLKDTGSIDIQIVYSTGRRAILAIEKGTPGERVFKDALLAWNE